MICKQCGNEAGSGKFCVNCGAPTGMAAAPLAGTAPTPATPSIQANTGQGMRRAHEVEFKIYGEDLQFVEIMLDPQETIVAEAGGMMYMDSEIKMDTIFGDGSGKTGNDLKSKLFSAGKRVLTGESLFMTAFTNTATTKKCVSFAAPYPGRVVDFDLTDYGGVLIASGTPFSAPPKASRSELHFRRKSGPDSSAGKASSCRGWKATAWPLCMPAGPLSKRNWPGVRP